VAGGVDGGDRGGGVQVDAVLGVPVLGVDQRVRQRAFVEHEVLGERRPLVRRVGLVGVHGQRSVVPALAELGDDGACGKASADDDDGCAGS